MAQHAPHSRRAAAPCTPRVIWRPGARRWAGLGQEQRRVAVPCWSQQGRLHPSQLQPEGQSCKAAGRRTKEHGRPAPGTAQPRAGKRSSGPEPPAVRRNISDVLDYGTRRQHAAASVCMTIRTKRSRAAMGSNRCVQPCRLLSNMLFSYVLQQRIGQFSCATALQNKLHLTVVQKTLWQLHTRLSAQQTCTLTYW